MSDSFTRVTGFLIFFVLMIILILDLGNFTVITKNLSPDNIDYLRALLAGLLMIGTIKFIFIRGDN